MSGNGAASGGSGWWDEISQLLDEALDIPESDRASWLAGLRADRPELAGRLTKLLREHDQLRRERFLESGPIDAPAAGRRVGAYTLRSLIGQGGMGSVWLAERTDGELRYHVAVKLLGGVVQGVQWRDRFLRERQLLASLNHPSIVRLLDAGHTDDGRPYLVMEHVAGLPIDQYARLLDVRSQVRLFLSVCDAVAHAHHRLIIHRDLKPSNILVDASGTPKLLDFGIAKLMDETADTTQTVERLLTPNYASPEQFEGGAQTTATDVFSLGAVLYKLVTGQSPHERAGGRHGAAPALRDIPAPSSLNPDVPEDLDYVLRTALRPEPDERYVSVDALAADLRRLLKHEPVDARAGDRWYRARTFARRNRLPLTAGIAVVASLVGGLYAVNRQRSIAARRFDQVRELANRFIELDGEIRSLPGSVRARNRIVSESLAYLARLGREAAADLDLSLEVGTAYMKVARVQGVPASANLGQYQAAEESLVRARQHVAAVLRGRPSQRAALLVAAQIERDHMSLLDYSNRREEAAGYALRSAMFIERVLATGTLPDDERNVASHVLGNLGVFYSNTNRLEEAIRYASRAADVAEGIETARARRAGALGVLSIALRRRGDFEEALRSAHQASAELTAMVGEAPDLRFNLHNALLREALVLCEDEGPSLGRVDEALAKYEAALAAVQASYDSDPSDFRAVAGIANVSRDYGAVLQHRSSQAGLRLFDAALAPLRATWNQRAKQEAASLLAASSYPLRALGRTDEALARLDQAIAVLKETGQIDDDAIEPFGEVETTLLALGSHYLETGHPSGALEVLTRLADRLDGSRLDPDADLRDAASLSRTWAAIENACRATGDVRGADVWHARRRRVWEQWMERRPDNVFVRRQYDTT
ncbi:MAG TPA: protein kinase [Vicinamibacterales bacterium]|nr:protein kinase [Vicinamibacterales bacterium]